MEAGVDEKEPFAYFDDRRIRCETRYDGINWRHDAMNQYFREGKRCIAEAKVMMGTRIFLIARAGSG